MTDAAKPTPASDDEATAESVPDAQPAGPSANRKRLWVIGGAIGVGYILYGIWQMITGS